MHPLKRKFEPVLLDRYPQNGMPDESRRRGNFPDYVPMFAFPNDINVVSSDTRPRSTWHGFSMTAADNSRLHAICIIVWIPMKHKAADELEKRCEEWRRANMSEVERELASSLGERLAAERAKLSRLLSRLPYIDSGSDARDQLEEEISSVEEKIMMMTDMLRPLRHGAASRIEGLTDGDTGLWIPRAFGILGRDASMTSFWKEWLRAITVPMADGAIMRVPASSPRVGMWQPLERYVINLCTEAPSPISSKTQVEIGVRELRLFARKEAINELPGSRGTDLYALFRALTIPNIMILFEYVLAESRIILLSSHTSMLHLVSKAMVELIWPLKWAGVFIPVLPARLVQALEAPCPYICGIERRYDKVELPDDDFVLVDLDNNEIESTARPAPMPRQQRRKLMSLLQLAAPHHNKFGVPVGPPPYAIEAMPFDSFASENPSVFSSNAQSTSLARLVGLTSTSFGTAAAADGPQKPLILNAFLHAKGGSRGRASGTGERPRTGSTSRKSNPDSPNQSPIATSFPQLPGTPATPVSRSDSGFALQSSLRDKRGAHFDSGSKGSGGSVHRQARRQPSLPFLGHSSNQSISTLNPDSPHHQSSYAPSAYAQSTLAASTIMPQMLVQPVRNTENTSWIEGHCLQWHAYDDRTTCSVCDEKADDGIYRCTGCGVNVHARCGYQLYIVCPVAFYPEQIRAAFVRCFASLFYTYRKYMLAPTAEQKRNGMFYRFDLNSFLRSMPHENADYIAVLQQTQGKISIPFFMPSKTIKNHQEPSN
jgi:DENN (AEX-3) domain/uDENN domain/C1 domain